MCELICDGCGEEIIDCVNYIELYDGIVFHDEDCEQRYYDEMRDLR
jgi:hypothetical protein